MSERRERIVLLGNRVVIVVTILLALIGLYFAAYRLCLAGKVYRPVGIDSTGINLYDIEPQYRTTAAGIESLLLPAHHVDRALRLEYWGTIETSSGRKWKNPTPQVEP